MTCFFFLTTPYLPPFLFYSFLDKDLVDAVDLSLVSPRAFLFAISSRNSDSLLYLFAVN